MSNKGKKKLACAEHVVTPYSGKDKDCCGDRVSCDVDSVCSCGFEGCKYCMNQHIMDLHRGGQLNLIGGLDG